MAQGHMKGAPNEIWTQVNADGSLNQAALQ